MSTVKGPLIRLILTLAHKNQGLVVDRGHNPSLGLGNVKF